MNSERNESDSDNYLKGKVKGKKVKKEKKNKKGKKTIETMFRITSSNNQKLSDMADNKANILVTVNSIIISIIISQMLRDTGEYTEFSFPTYTIICTSMLTIIIAVISIIPMLLPSGLFTKKEIENKTVNLLFFGNYYRMGFEDYRQGMIKVMGDRDFLYGSLIKDEHSQGIALGRKFRLLRVAYYVFMIGIAASVVGYFITTASHYPWSTF
jgi:hypothetical protein